MYTLRNKSSTERSHSLWSRFFNAAASRYCISAVAAHVPGWASYYSARSIYQVARFSFYFLLHFCDISNRRISIHRTYRNIVSNASIYRFFPCFFDVSQYRFSMYRTFRYIGISYRTFRYIDFFFVFSIYRSIDFLCIERFDISEYRIERFDISENRKLVPVPGISYRTHTARHHTLVASP